ncbi:unnamed protein product [Prorocentrum cordatum]|uniref:subtilisin n=1 Tax=Prorocentrum cordatum TaxID=2364126 RepID=A0ABN9QFU0_9DINO|nr:unnamed protein product [Polarella glacialis]
MDVASTGSLTYCLPDSTTCFADDHGHGTASAGVVGVSTYGVADGATLWSMKVFDANADGYTAWSVAAEQWAVLTNGLRPAVVNVGLSGALQSPSEKESIE